MIIYFSRKLLDIFDIWNPAVVAKPGQVHQGGDSNGDLLQARLGIYHHVGQLVKLFQDEVASVTLHQVVMPSNYSYMQGFCRKFLHIIQPESFMMVSILVPGIVM